MPHHVRIRYVVTCDECGDLADVGTIGEGTAFAITHEAHHNGPTDRPEEAPDLDGSAGATNTHNDTQNPG